MTLSQNLKPLLSASLFAFGLGAAPFAMAATSASLFEQEAPVGVRPQGMGNAFVAVANDVNAVYWNPAGLALINNQQVQATWQDRFGLGIQYNYIGYAQKNYGGSWAHQDAGGFLLGGGDYTSDIFTFAGATQIDDFTFLGGAIKFIKLDYSSPAACPANSACKDASSDGYALDVGLMHIVDPQTTVGAVVREATSSVKSSSAGSNDRYDNNILVGFSRKMNDRTLLALQFGNLGKDTTLHLGVETKMQENLMLRAGYDDDLWTAGLGVKQDQWELNYAYLNDNNISGSNQDSHKFGGTLHF